jgi:hypothetical protein
VQRDGKSSVFAIDGDKARLRAVTPGQQMGELRLVERIATDHPGVGLGLAIVKSITQAHDGTLTLTPRATGGLCATVRLPATTMHAPAEVSLARGPLFTTVRERERPAAVRD